MEIVVYLIPALMAFGAASSGWMRVAARSYVPLMVSLLVLSMSTVGCWLIGATKTGTFLAGLGGTLMAMLLGIGAVALVAGAVFRLLHEVLHVRIKRQPAPTRVPPARPWDVMALAALSAIALLFSATE